MRIGFAGCGRAVSSLHLPALSRIAPGVRVTALADTDAARRDRLAREWGVERRYDGWAGLAADSNVDLVVIAVPTAMHRDALLAAAAAGKHVYLEKPIALTLEQADDMLRAWDGVPARVTMGFNLRSHRLVRRAHALIQSGELGRVQSIRTLLVGGVSNRPPWQTDPAQGGGPVFELGIHHFDLWRYLLNEEPAGVRALHSPERGAVTVSARFTGGALATGTFAMAGTAAHEVEVSGEKGSLSFSLYRGDSFRRQPGGRVAEIKSWLADLPEAVRAARNRGDYLDSYRVHWLRFLESIERGTPVPSPLEDGQAALRVALEAGV